VLSKITSASSGVSVSTMPFAALSISAMREESYSFIWQPKVLINTFFGADELVTTGVDFSLVGFKGWLQIYKG
jgi:hypothetical protein